ncbi:MAG: ATP-binding cassette domain-containing protein [Ferruginibacter sp.]|nr:ATP-binding cassette domain-containing protein [Ferruginibacter sp.]
MQIELKNIAPKFLEKEKIANSQVWQKKLFFEKGRKIQIVAPSGSGKTSLIHFLYGLRNDYAGSIFFNNKNVKDFDNIQLAKMRAIHMSIVFQDLRLFKEHNTFQNIEIKRALAPYHSVSQISEMAERLGIKNKLTQQAETCSYGEQQRIAIIRALQQPFDLIVLDEPFSHLDENNSKIALNLIEEEAAQRNASIILADLHELPFFKADTTIYL